MKDYCIVLRYVDAKLFANFSKKNGGESSKCDGYGCDSKGRSVSHKRYSYDFNHMTFHVSQISNMLHVLCNERPVPTLRQHAGVLKRCDAVYDLAKDSRIKVETPSQSVVSGGKSLYPKETFTIRKCKANSWRANGEVIEVGGIKRKIGDGYLTWDNICAYLDFELFADLHRILLRVCLDYRSRTVKEVFETYYADEELQSFLDTCASNNKTSLFNLLSMSVVGNKGVELGRIVKSSEYISDRALKYKSLLTTGIETVYNLSGYIYVPVSKNDIDMFKKGNGFATLCEGGVVHIEKIVKLSDSLLINTKEVAGA